MADAPTPPGSQPATSPQIGVDEWVKRSGERITGPGGIVGGSLRLATRTPPAVLLALFVGLACVIPVLTSNGYVIGVDADTMLYVLLAVGLNVAVGWAGLLDLGYVAFYGFAAYFYAELSSAHYNLHWPTWQSVPLVVAATILLGFVLALPSRRLSGDYLAIVTLFFLEIFNNFTSNGYAWDWLGFGAKHDITGGPTGINNVDPFRVFGHKLTNSPTDYVWVAAAGFTVVAILFAFVNKSRTGRAWRALREDQLAAEVMGIPVKWLMLLAVAVGAGVAGFAGAVNGAYYQGVFPDTFMFPLLITIYAMVILGGAGSLGGVVFGAVVVNVLLEILRTPYQARWVFYAAVLIGILAKVRPWRLLAAFLVATAAFGVIVNEIVGALWARGVAGPIAVGPTSYAKTGFFATLLRHWMVLPAKTYTDANYAYGNYAFVLAIVLVLASTVVTGWRRWALLVPTLWVAAFAWENTLIEQAPTTRPLLLGVILIVLMATRPAGLFGQTRVEVV
ncbi:MAG TPA: branched-chain amino acid ABC transporter permease [Gaiellaceae bacterium]|nr:branched-chain amino acid ABC transporter permease [Gaiellaceae bacterium]